MLSVIYAECNIQTLCAESRHTECGYAECRSAPTTSIPSLGIHTFSLLTLSTKTFGKTTFSITKNVTLSKRLCVSFMLSVAILPLC
jgi:hypothetical protein